MTVRHALRVTPSRHHPLGVSGFRLCPLVLMRTARAEALPPPAKLALALAGREALPVLYLDDPLPRVFAASLWQPSVVVTRGALERLDGAEWGAVLLHEEAQLRHRDPLKLLVLPLWTQGLFYLPAVSAVGRRYEVRKESVADAYALARTRPLLSALAKLLPGGWAADARTGLVPGATDERAWRLEHLGGHPGEGARRRLVSPATPGLTRLGLALLVAAVGVTGR